MQYPSTLPNRGRSRQRARLGRTISQAPEAIAIALHILLDERKVQKGSPERILEAKRIIQVSLLTDPLPTPSSRCLRRHPHHPLRRRLHLPLRLLPRPALLE